MCGIGLVLGAGNNPILIKDIVKNIEQLVEIGGIVHKAKLT